MKANQRLTGHGNPGMQQFQQIATSASATVMNFSSFKAVGGNAEIAEILNVDGTSALSYFGASATAYQNILYPGNFKSITLTSGVGLLYLNEQ
jgi:hypothetical protein